MSKNVCIVAIPDETDDVWDISTEKVPHLTLLFLGDAVPDDQVAHITEFLEHVTNTMLVRPFELSSSRRGVLGPDKADVLFFEKYGVDKVKAFRSALLQDPSIKTAYDSIEQYDPWLPHLTLGYPESPAIELEDKWRNKLNWVQFNRIAIWFGDSEGPEFQLNSEDYDMDIDMGVPMSAITHHGVKGMKWGVRKAETSESSGATSRATRKADKKFTKKFSGTSGFVQVHNSVADKINPKLDALNDKPEYKEADFRSPSPLRQKYYGDYKKLLQESVNETAAEINSTATGSKKLSMTIHDNGPDDLVGWSYTIDEAKHSATEPITFRIKFILDTTGHIKGQTFVPIDEASVAVQHILSHHGIKGMKWGVRRTTSADGTVKVTGTATAGKAKIKTSGGAGAKPHADAIAARVGEQKLKKGGINSLSNKDLQELQNRLNLEQNVKRLSANNAPPAKKFISSLLGNAGKQQANRVANDVAAKQVTELLNKK